MRGSSCADCDWLLLSLFLVRYSFANDRFGALIDEVDEKSEKRKQSGEKTRLVG
jgi:hypothetical protein